MSALTHNRLVSDSVLGNIAQEWGSCSHSRPNLTVQFIYISVTVAPICTLLVVIHLYVICKLPALCSVREGRRRGGQEVGVGGGWWGLQGHGSCNYHSQVQVTGQVVAVPFFFLLSLLSPTGLHVAQHASTAAPLWLGVLSSSRLRPMRAGSTVMAGKLTERSIKWQLCYDMSARTWWMVSGALFFSWFLPLPLKLCWEHHRRAELFHVIPCLKWHDATVADLWHCLEKYVCGKPCLVSNGSTAWLTQISYYPLRIGFTRGTIISSFSVAFGRCNLCLCASVPGSRQTTLAEVRDIVGKAVGLLFETHL